MLRRREAADTGEPSGTCDHYRETGCTINAAFSFQGEKGGKFGHFAHRFMERKDFGFFIFQRGVTDDLSCLSWNRCMKNRMR